MGAGSERREFRVIAEVTFDGEFVKKFSSDWIDNSYYLASEQGKVEAQIDRWRDTYKTAALRNPSDVSIKILYQTKVTHTEITTSYKDETHSIVTPSW